MYCGHDREIGLTLPLEELERRGLVNERNRDIDPRQKERIRHAKDKFEKREFEKIIILLKGVSHWMDRAGIVHQNCLHGNTTWQIQNMKKIKSNQLEMEMIHEGILRMLDYMKRTGETPEHYKVAASTGGRSVNVRKTTIMEGEESPVTTTITTERFSIE